MQKGLVFPKCPHCEIRMEHKYTKPYEMVRFRYYRCPKCGTKIRTKETYAVQAADSNIIKK